jgi:hypothetical protein
VLVFVYPKRALCTLRLAGATRNNHPGNHGQSWG